MCVCACVWLWPYISSSFHLCVFAPFAILDTKYAFELLKFGFCSSSQIPWPFGIHTGTLQSFSVFRCSVRYTHWPRTTTDTHRLGNVVDGRTSCDCERTILQFRIAFEFLFHSGAPILFIIYLFEIIYLPIFVPFRRKTHRFSIDFFHFILSSIPFTVIEI